MIQTQIRIDGELLSSLTFGADYLDEYRRVILQHVAPVTGAFLEWGAGHTTVALAQLRKELGVRTLCTIDHNRAYLQAVLAATPRFEGLRAYARELQGPSCAVDDPELAYATAPLAWRESFDFIFIDGRRRMECAFVAALLCHERTVVALHDYRRARYQAVLAFYDILEDGRQFRVMRLKPALLGLRPPWELLDRSIARKPPPPR